MGFPLAINAEVGLPDQVKVVKKHKSRLRKMLAAQRDIHGGFRMNVDAQVGERQLVKVLEDVSSSSRKTCELSPIIAVRSSKPARKRTGGRPSESWRTAAKRCCMRSHG
jgi:hypothetical protein